jgi:hypothetical protein
MSIADSAITDFQGADERRRKEATFAIVALLVAILFLLDGCHVRRAHTACSSGGHGPVHLGSQHGGALSVPGVLPHAPNTWAGSGDDLLTGKGLRSIELRGRPDVDWPNHEIWPDDPPSSEDSAGNSAPDGEFHDDNHEPYLVYPFGSPSGGPDISFPHGGPNPPFNPDSPPNDPPFTPLPSPHNQVSGVPEPTTWTMMLIGLGVLGFVLRRRKKLKPAF